MKQLKESVEMTDMDVLDNLEDDFTSETDLEMTEVFSEEQEFDVSLLTPSACSQKERTAGKAGVMSIVHSKNGMRVALSKELMQRLGHPESVQIGYLNGQIAVSSHLGDAFTSYPLRQSGTKRIIYRAELVKEITDRFQLDFHERTSITFREASYKKKGNSVIALIKVNV
jgi:hypothetical protein